MRAACELTQALESVAPFALQPCGANWRTGRHVTAMCGAYSVVRIECSYSVVHIYSVVHMVCAHSTWLTLLSEQCSQHTVHFAVCQCTSEFTNAVALHRVLRAFTKCAMRPLTRVTDALVCDPPSSSTPSPSLSPSSSL